MVNIKKLKKKVLTFGLAIGGLAAILSGCGNVTTDYKTTQIFKDLNMDGKPDQVYMVYTGWITKKVDTLFLKNVDKCIHTYELRMREGIGEGAFGEEKVIQKFEGKPEEVKVEDITGDKIPDLVYLVHTGWTVKKAHHPFLKDANKCVLTYELRMRKGRGDGTFEAPKLIQKYVGKPEGLR